MSAPLTLHARESGRDRPVTVLLLHGGGLNGSQWASQLDQLAEFHCIAPDLPEHGGSAAFGPLTLADAAQRLLALLDRLAGDKPVHVVAHSFGGAIALHLLGQVPRRFASMLMSGGPAGLSSALASLSILGSGLPRLFPVDWLVELTVRQFRLPDAARADFDWDLRRSMDPDFIRRLTREMQRLALPGQNLTPVLALVGEHETWAARQAARQIGSGVAQARAFVVPGAHHVWNLEFPQLFSQVVRDWVLRSEVASPLQPLSVFRKESP